MSSKHQVRAVGSFPENGGCRIDHADSPPVSNEAIRAISGSTAFHSQGLVSSSQWRESPASFRLGKFIVSPGQSPGPWSPIPSPLPQQFSPATNPSRHRAWRKNFTWSTPSQSLGFAMSPLPDFRGFTPTVLRSAKDFYRSQTAGSADDSLPAKFDVPQRSGYSSGTEDHSFKSSRSGRSLALVAIAPFRHTVLGVPTIERTGSKNGSISRSLADQDSPVESQEQHDYAVASSRGYIPSEMDLSMEKDQAITVDFPKAPSSRSSMLLLGQFVNEVGGALWLGSTLESVAMGLPLLRSSTPLFFRGTSPSLELPAFFEGRRQQPENLTIWRLQLLFIKMEFRWQIHSNRWLHWWI